MECWEHNKSQETPVQFHTNLSEHGLCKYFDVGLWNCFECLNYSDGASGDNSTPLMFLSFSLCVCVLCEYLCPTRYDSTSWWGQRGLINPADHLLLQANHWRYKGVLCKTHIHVYVLTKCSQTAASILPNLSLQQICLGGICLYALFIFYIERRENS